MTNQSDRVAEPPFAIRVGRFLNWLNGMLRRSTQSMAYIPEIDGLRFVAIASVVVYHMTGMISRAVGGPGPQLWFQFARTGNIGVQIFFGISGFVLAVPFLRAFSGTGRPVVLKRYFLRRLTRLEPPYLICLLLLFLLYHLGVRDSLTKLLWSALYSYGFVYNDFSAINFVAWSLEIEVQFYVVMPLLAHLLLRWRNKWIRRGSLILLCVPLILRQYILYEHFPHGLSLLDQIQFFAVGVVLADVFVNDWRESFSSEKWTALVAADAIATIGWLGIPSSVLWARDLARLLVPLAMMAAFAGSLRGQVWRAFLRNRWITAIGGMCYTIYLYHWFLMRWAKEALGGFVPGGFHPNLIRFGPVFLGAVLLGSAALYVAFEKPFMVWKPVQPKVAPEARDR